MKFVKSQIFAQVVTLVEMRFREALRGNCENVGEVEKGFSISFRWRIFIFLVFACLKPAGKAIQRLREVREEREDCHTAAKKLLSSQRPDSWELQENPQPKRASKFARNLILKACGSTATLTMF